MPDQPEKKSDKTGPYSETEPGLGWEPDRPPGEAEEQPTAFDQPLDAPSVDSSAVRDALGRLEGRGSQSGRVLNGLYQVEELIGEGGMGSVYAARHLHLQKRFAVKLFRNAQETSDSSLVRFRQEAIAASRIDHPHIIDVVNFDQTEDGTVFMVMELLEGKNLAEILFAGPIPVERTLRLVRQMGDALGAAHGRGIVHRDLKPENIFVVQRRGEDFVKILDFGISKMRAEGEESVRITHTGQVLGTPRYISPEQARGETEIDHRADIYALGAIAYEMLCGQPPFEGRNYAHLLWQHANSEPPPLGDRTPCALPPALERTVMRTLEKEPEKRFHSVSEMLEALDRAATESGLAVASPGRPPVRPLVNLRSVGIAAALLLALLGSVWWLGRESATNDRLAEKARTASGEAEQGRPTTARAPVQAAPAQAAAATTASGNTAPPLAAPGSDTAPQEPTEPIAEQAAATLTVRFESLPLGASVSVNGKALGKTPVSAPVRADGEPIRAVFSAPGYQKQTITVEPVKGEPVQARLRRLPARKKPEPALPIKRDFR